MSHFCSTPVLRCKLSDRSPPLAIPDEVRYRWARCTPEKWRVSQVKPESMFKVRELAEKWRCLAETRQLAAENVKPPTPSSERDAMEARTSATTNESIEGRLTRLSDKQFPPDAGEVYVCKDLDDKPQGIMVLNHSQKIKVGSDELQKYTEIVWLSVHPRHFRTGAGSILIQQAAKRALQLGRQGLFLISFVTAQLFYKDLGAETAYIFNDSDASHDVVYHFRATKLRELLN